MTRSRYITFLAGAAAVPLTAVVVAGCGGGGGGATASPAPHRSTAAPGPATVRVASTGLGKVLVDSQGHTLYLFKKDTGTRSTCTGACATAWPPLVATGKPTVGTGVNASLVGTTTRSDGTTQVTYNGHPLYRFIKDTAPGNTNGEGLTAFGGSWFAVSPAGNQVSSGTSKAAAPKPAPQPPAPKPAPQPAAPQPAPQPAAPRPVAPKPAAPANNGIPQNGGGDGDSDNNGGPSDGDGNV